MRSSAVKCEREEDKLGERLGEIFCERFGRRLCMHKRVGERLEEKRLASLWMRG